MHHVVQCCLTWVLSCGFVRTEGHECSVHRVLFDFWYREWCIYSLSLTKCLSCVCCCCFRVSWLSLVYWLPWLYLWSIRWKYLQCFHVLWFLVHHPWWCMAFLLHPVGTFHADAPTVAVDFWCSLRWHVGRRMFLLSWSYRSPCFGTL